MNANNTTFRVCSTCKQTIPATSEYFHKNKASRDGLNNVCKVCAKRTSLLHYHDNKQLMPFVPLPPDTKDCSKCRKLLPLTDVYFHRDKNKSDGFKGNCKDCQMVMNQNWIENNREYYLDQKREWRKANPDKVRAHKNASQKRHRSAANERVRRFNKRNPDKANVWTHRRLARVNDVPFDFTFDDWQYALDYFNHSCAVCGRSAGFWHTIAKDHWIPLKADNCPGTIPSNIIPLCHVTKDGEGACNNSKGKKDAEQWLSEHYTPKQAKTILARIDAYFATVRK